MAGHKKEGQLPSELAVQATAAVVRACPEIFAEAVRARMASKREEWHVAAAAEFMALLRLLKKERDFPGPMESLPGFEP